MLPEILAQNLDVVFVGTAVGETSDELGFYSLEPKNRFWEMLEYARITPSLIISKSDRKALVGAKQTGVLNDLYKQFFFEKKESMLLKCRTGLTVLNRRAVVSGDDDPVAEPIPADVKKFVNKIEKFRPKIAAFLTSPDIFEKCLKPFFPQMSRQRGKQEFLIGASEVWLIGSTSGRTKAMVALEEVFDGLAERLNALKEST